MASPAGSPDARNDRAAPVLELAWSWRLTAVPMTPDCPPGLATLTRSLDMTHPPAALLHSLCIANVPVVSRRSVATFTHLSPISPPLTLSARSIHPLSGDGSVMLSAYSWPASSEVASYVPADPALTMFSPHTIPSSSW